MTILEQIWYEELRPAEIIKPQSHQYKESLDVADESEKKLLHLLDDEGKELFHKYKDAWTDVYDMDGCDFFINGFCIGAKLMLEIMNNDKKGE